jgi:shikimate dehydrogenase
MGGNRRKVVTGRTLVVPLIGHPVEQVKSPGPMNRWLDENDVDAVIVPMDIRPEKVAVFFEVLRAMENCVGCSITMPHKQAAFVASDEVTDRARRARAVNTIRRSPMGRLIGDMTDGLAFISALADKGVLVEGRNALIVGAGGAGTAIAFELAASGAAQLVVTDIDRMRQRALISELLIFHPELVVHDRIPAGLRIDIAINASPAGMNEDDPLPCRLEELEGVTIVADAVTKPLETPWLKAAMRRGIRIQTGEEMAVAQLPIQLAYLRLMPAPIDGRERTFA